MILDKVVCTVWVQTYPVRIREERNNFLFISSTAWVQLDTGESKTVKKKKNSDFTHSCLIALSLTRSLSLTLVSLTLCLLAITHQLPFITHLATQQPNSEESCKRREREKSDKPSLYMLGRSLAFFYLAKEGGIFLFYFICYRFCEYT